jgi:hypothetical protein
MRSTNVEEIHQIMARMASRVAGKDLRLVLLLLSCHFVLCCEKSALDSFADNTRPAKAEFTPSPLQLYLDHRHFITRINLFAPILPQSYTLFLRAALHIVG